MKHPLLTCVWSLYLRKNVYEKLWCEEIFMWWESTASQFCGPADCRTHGSVSSPNFLFYSPFRREKKSVGWCWWWWWVNTPLQPKTQPLLSCWNLRPYLSVPSRGPRSRFALALFQVWEVKCKQFTDLLWLGRAKGFSWEECNLNTTSQGGSAARWSIHAYCVRA